MSAKRRTPAIFDRRLPETEPRPQYIAFPEFEFPPPAASPVIGILYGRDLLRDRSAEPWAHPRFLPFPYIEPAANLVPPPRYAQVVLLPFGAFVGGASPAYTVFPFGGVGGGPGPGPAGQDVALFRLLKFWRRDSNLT